jgi:hypothetical protein
LQQTALEVQEQQLREREESLEARLLNAQRQQVQAGRSRSDDVKNKEAATRLLSAVLKQGKSTITTRVLHRITMPLLPVFQHSASAWVGDTESGVAKPATNASLRRWNSKRVP